MILKIGKDGFVALDHFNIFLDITRVEYYDLKESKDGTLILKFYDKNEKLIKLKRNKNGKINSKKQKS